MAPRDPLLSLNEVETLGAKAARGAGLAWGLAEDVGRATRWMAERGIDWSPASLCLTEAGAADGLLRVVRLADLVPGAPKDLRWTLEAAVPLWTLAILSGALRGRDTTLDVAWAEVAVRLWPDGGVSTSADLDGLAASGAETVTVTVGGPAPLHAGAGPARHRRSRVPIEALRRLETLSARTYVAASTQSRATGAGGGRVDDD